jgi:CDP-glycerol glycerophosphotransferase
MKEHGGYTVEATPEGIYGGLKAFAEGKVKAMNVDYEQYNKKAASQFEALLDIKH